MSESKTIKAGDLWPPLQYTVSYADLDLDLTTTFTSSTPVTFTMRKRNTGVVAINAVAGTVAVGTTVVASLVWPAGSTDSRGTYDAWMVFTVSGKQATVPSRGYLEIVIE